MFFISIPFFYDQINRFEDFLRFKYQNNFVYTKVVFSKSQIPFSKFQCLLIKKNFVTFCKLCFNMIFIYFYMLKKYDIIVTFWDIFLITDFCLLFVYYLKQYNLCEIHFFILNLTLYVFS